MVATHGAIETLVLIRASISIFLGLSVVCRVWFLKFRISQAVLHRFLISEDIHLILEISLLVIIGRRFFISSQLCDIIPIRAWSHTIVGLFFEGVV